MTRETEGAVTMSTAPQILHVVELYTPPERSSTPFAGTERDRLRRIREVLGEMLLASHQSSLTDGDRAALLHCIEGLERKLIDFRRRGNTYG